MLAIYSYQVIMHRSYSNVLPDFIALTSVFNRKMIIVGPVQNSHLIL